MALHNAMVFYDTRASSPNKTIQGHIAEAVTNLNYEHFSTACMNLLATIDEAEWIWGPTQIRETLTQSLLRTCRNPRFALRVADTLPDLYKPAIRRSIIFQFMNKFFLPEIIKDLKADIDLLKSNKYLVRKILVQLVIDSNDELFFFLTDRMEIKTDFRLKQFSFLSDCSEYDCGPDAHPGNLWEKNASFHELIELCGTPSMRKWRNRSSNRISSK